MKSFFTDTRKDNWQEQQMFTVLLSFGWFDVKVFNFFVIWSTSDRLFSVEEVQSCIFQLCLLIRYILI